uniref:Uncharacterized protein n=1 Tax=Timspurckia oligopyrenoides TaxID=708627 RepID=A0A7S0ZF83_9RHOD|mmetsp:Transcript_3048/g.5392  ORF Transcript_3048/g.5392 Transcript_3048/m.5392 type:complete len:126 (+) Transcript_3048:83-460(+)
MLNNLKCHSLDVFPQKLDNGSFSDIFNAPTLHLRLKKTTVAPKLGEEFCPDSHNRIEIQKHLSTEHCSMNNEWKLTICQSIDSTHSYMQLSRIQMSSRAIAYSSTCKLYENLFILVKSNKPTAFT